MASSRQAVNGYETTLRDGVVTVPNEWGHGVATIVLFLFFNAQAIQEETWLAHKYADDSTYQQQVRKFIPWVY